MVLEVPLQGLCSPIGPLRVLVDGDVLGAIPEHLDAALGWIKRIDATASAQLLENMPPNKAAILLERIESGDAQELMSHMKPERLFYVRKFMGKAGNQAPADEG